MKQVKIPQFFNYSTFDEVLNQHKALIEGDDCQPSEEVIFDCSENRHISILGLLFLAQFSDFLQLEKKCKCVVRSKKESNPSWFTRVMGLTKPNEADKKIENYLNGIRVSIQRCHNNDECLEAVNKVIPIIRFELKPPEPLLKALNWALWELVGNAGLHGYSMYGKKNTNYPKPVYFCAFDYKEFIDMAILDVGRGIRTSFLESGNAKYKNISNIEALTLAIKNKETCDPHGSAGLGLFGCAEIARIAKGKLVIISGPNKLIVSEGKEEILPSSNFEGTMVLLSLPQKATINLASIFDSNNLIVTESFDDIFGDFND